MECIKCHSPRIIRFWDGFGNRRVFCKSCHESILLEEVIMAQRKLVEFGQGGESYAAVGNTSIKLAGR